MLAIDQMHKQSKRLHESRNETKPQRSELEEISDFPSRRITQNRDWMRGDDHIEPVIYVNRLG